MDKMTMIVALVHCLSNENWQDETCYQHNCEGCPLQDQPNCMYKLKMATVNELMTNRVLIPEHSAMPSNIIEEILGGEFNA